MDLLAHMNWQVRAEAAEGLEELVSSLGGAASQKADVYAALIERLADADGFGYSAIMGSYGSYAYIEMKNIQKAGAMQNPDPNEPIAIEPGPVTHRVTVSASFAVK